MKYETRETQKTSDHHFKKVNEKSLKITSYESGFRIFVSHLEPEAADKFSNDRDELFEPILSTCRPES